jgi:peptidylprolyl isomerase
MSESTRLKSTVYVGGLDQAVTSQTLAEAFVPFGEVVDISLPKPDAPNSSDVHRGFGYVEFDLPQDAKEAIDNMDGSELYGRTIKVAAAKPQKDANEGLGSKTAIWEQVRVNCILISVALRLTQHRITGGLSGQVRSQRRGPTSSRRSPGRGQPPARPDAGIGTARRCRTQARIMYTITMDTKIMKEHERPFCRNTPSKFT